MNTSTCLQQNLIQPYTATLCSFPDCPIVGQRDSVIDRMTTEIEQLQKEKNQLAENYERLKALLNKRNSSLFGRSSEKLLASANDQQTDDHDSANDSAPVPKKKRGARFGHKGHGRKIPDLPEVEEILQRFSGPYPGHEILFPDPPAPDGYDYADAGIGYQRGYLDGHIPKADAALGAPLPLAGGIQPQRRPLACR
jgi:hypothetical protein